MRAQVSQLKGKSNEVDSVVDLKALKPLNIELRYNVVALQSQNKPEIEKLKAELKGKMQPTTIDAVKPIVLAPGKYAIDVDPIPPPQRNNRDAHIAYLRHLKDNVEILREIVEEGSIANPLDSVLQYACRVRSCIEANGSKPSGNTRKDRILSAKKQVEEHPRNNKSSVQQKNRVGSSISYKRTVINLNSSYVCKTYNKCFVSDIHDKCRTDHPLVFGLRLLKTYDWESLAAQELHQKVYQDRSRGSNLYTISVEDMMRSSPICLLSKASKNKSWLWHRRLNHLNFSTINELARKNLVRGLPRLKYEKDHLCSACQLGKSKKHNHPSNSKNTNVEVLHTLHMDLCGPMRVLSINGKKYILVIVDDYSRFTWAKFLRTKDETPEFVIKFLTQIQTGLNKTVRFIRTDNGT
ncbi:retrovirus-related pol polyprotein from transposon TNT 1-94 [Tanacetum coccineum]